MDTNDKCLILKNIPKLIRFNSIQWVHHNLINCISISGTTSLSNAKSNFSEQSVIVHEQINENDKFHSPADNFSQNEIDIRQI